VEATGTEAGGQMASAETSQTEIDLIRGHLGALVRSRLDRGWTTSEQAEYVTLTRRELHYLAGRDAFAVSDGR
jgi:hypothetical protein